MTVLCLLIAVLLGMTRAIETGVNAPVSPAVISPRIARIDTNVREKLVKIRGKNVSDVLLGDESNCTQLKRSLLNI